MALDLDRFEWEGFAMEPSLLSSGEIADLLELIERDVRTKLLRGGVRDVMDSIPELRKVADHPSVRLIVDKVLGPDAFVVRSTLFDKTAEANWKIPWHQDLTIAVEERRDADGYWPWSIKNGIQHVQPPTHVLDRMVTIRIHLDPCPSFNGAVRVMPGTHLLGRVNQNSVEEYVDEQSAVICSAEVGEALLMRPLLFHASSAAQTPEHRRILHFDFATGELDNGLQWRSRS